MMASSVIPPTHFSSKLFRLQFHSSLKPISVCPDDGSFSRRRRFYYLKIGRGCSSAISAKAGSGSGGFPFDVSFEDPSAPEAKPVESSPPNTADAYLPLFVKRLGMDNDPLDREQAVVAVWKYSLKGKQRIDRIMQFGGCINLVINLLKSQSSSAREAAAGLLREISSINSYRNVVAESGAVEELAALLSRPSLTAEVKEQCLCALCNLSADETVRAKMPTSDILPLLFKYLDDEVEPVNESAGGVLANLVLSRSNHSILVEAGGIPKLAKYLTREVEGSKIIRREAKAALLELAEDEYYRILIMEEGLLQVPLVGRAAFESLRPSQYSWPSLPDGTELKRAPKVPSRYGASELLVGLSREGNNVNLDESKVSAIVGRTQQQFLARLRAIENESAKSSNAQYTLLPWKEGVARLVLILEVNDDSAIARAAYSIANAAINERVRIMFKEAGGLKHLVRLLDHESGSVRIAVINALEKLSMSNAVCRVIEAEGIVPSLVRTLKDSEGPEVVTEKVELQRVGISRGLSSASLEPGVSSATTSLSLKTWTLTTLARLLDPNKEMKTKELLDADGAESMEDYKPNTTAWIDELDSAFIVRLVEILKTSPPRLQGEVASVLGFMTMVEPLVETIVSADVGSGIAAAFEQRVLRDLDSDVEALQPEQLAADLEEAGMAVSATSRLLARLLDFDSFLHTINTEQLKNTLLRVLKSHIPPQHKEWVAASLVKLAPSEDLIGAEVTLYEAIPRLIDQIANSASHEVQESAALELNGVISEGVAGAVQAVVAQGGVPPLVEVVEGGSERAVEAALGVLQSLSADSENHGVIVAAGAERVLQRMIVLQRPHWQRALRLLRTLPV